MHNDNEELIKIENANLLYTISGTHGEKGSGPRLAISREFIERHNGHLIIESSPGKGSSFGFRYLWSTPG